MTAGALGTRSSEGRSRTATTGSTSAGAIPVPKDWLAASMQPAAAALRVVRGGEPSARGASSSGVQSTKVPASAWPYTLYQPRVPAFAGLTANMTALLIALAPARPAGALRLRLPGATKTDGGRG